MGFVIAVLFWVVVVLSGFRCCSVVLGGRGAKWVSLLQCSFIKGITPKIRLLCFVLINSVLYFRTLCVCECCLDLTL